MKMAITSGKTTQVVLASGIAMLLAGCGLTQKVTDGTVAVTKSIFYKQVKILHLDIRAREAMNNGAYLSVERPESFRLHRLPVTVCR
jgi:type VI secretion system protein VasD